MKLPITLPFGEFIELIKIMFESNPLVEITTGDGVFQSYEEIKFFIYNTRFSRVNTDMTITSIEVRLPSFNIGDTVMIVDTGEIGEIESVFGNQSVELKSGTYVEGYERLVKIPPSLLDKLQD